MKQDDRFWLLVSRHLASEASANEEEELNVLIRDSEELRIRFDSIVAYWGKGQQEEKVNVDNAYTDVLSKINASNAAKVQRHFYLSASWIFKIAAILILTIGAGWYVFTSLLSNQNTWISSLTWESKHNTKGERSKITLSDGSTVWLNAESEIKYPDEFATNMREVYLNGEAFFDVTKNPNKPFIIHLSNGDVQVLGTSFNVKAFEDEPNVETSVLTGKVLFIAPLKNGMPERDTIRITPNYKAVYTKISGEIKKKKTNSIDDKSWTDGRLVFKSQRFEDVAKVLERNFGKQVVFGNEDLKNCKLTGTFQNNSLDEVMQLFAQTKDYTYVITQHELQVSGSGCAAY